ncbi:unnamed protein product [Gordionus sp. m RMFG-2023]
MTTKKQHKIPIILNSDESSNLSKTQIDDPLMKPYSSHLSCTIKHKDNCDKNVRSNLTTYENNILPTLHTQIHNNNNNLEKNIIETGTHENDLNVPTILHPSRSCPNNMDSINNIENCNELERIPKNKTDYSSKNSGKTIPPKMCQNKYELKEILGT